MEEFKIETKTQRVAFTQEHSGPRNRIFSNLVDKMVHEVVAHMKESEVDDEKITAVHSVVEKELQALLEENADFINGETVSWDQDISLASSPELAEEAKTLRLRELLDEKTEGGLIEMLSGKV